MDNKFGTSLKEDLKETMSKQREELGKGAAKNQLPESRACTGAKVNKMHEKHEKKSHTQDRSPRSRVTSTRRRRQGKVVTGHRGPHWRVRAPGNNNPDIKC